jgi:hypothetical protein
MSAAIWPQRGGWDGGDGWATRTMGGDTYTLPKTGNVFRHVNMPTGNFFRYIRNNVLVSRLGCPHRFGSGERTRQGTPRDSKRAELPDVTPPLTLRYVHVSIFRSFRSPQTFFRRARGGCGASPHPQTPLQSRLEARGLRWNAQRYPDNPLTES